MGNALENWMPQELSPLGVGPLTLSLSLPFLLLFFSSSLPLPHYSLLSLQAPIAQATWTVFILPSIFILSHILDPNMAIKEPTSLAGQALADSALLQKIDKLFECNVGEYVDLPQLVVVGDQSSGKSSVLEGLTKVNFPRDSGLCTRFATKITFRRDLSIPQREISASIVPSAQVDEDERHKLQAWKAADLQSLSPQEFSKMMHEVHEPYYFLVTSGLTTSSRSMSKWVSLLKMAIKSLHSRTTFYKSISGAQRKATSV